MQQDKPTIKLTVPTGWDKLDDHQLRYVFGLLAQGFPSPQAKTYCLFRWTGMQVMHRYGKGWWCKFADDEFRKASLATALVLPQVLRLSHATEGVP